MSIFWLIVSGWILIIFAVILIGITAGILEAWSERRTTRKNMEQFLKALEMNDQIEKRR
jgi:hypothetical protein